MSQPIINRPDLQTFQQKYGQSLITIIFWVLFFFFMRPLIGLVGWCFGVQLFTDVMVVKGGYVALVELLGWYLGIIFLMGAILKGWAFYNLCRFGRNEKRLRQPEPVTVEQLAQQFQLDTGFLRSWQDARRVIMEHDDQGRLASGTGGAGCAPVATASALERGGGQPAPFSGESAVPAPGA